jgi:hypothetical protein
LFQFSKRRRHSSPEAIFVRRLVQFNKLDRIDSMPAFPKRHHALETGEFHNDACLAEASNPTVRSKAEFSRRIPALNLNVR